MASIDIAPSMQIDLFSHSMKVTRFNQMGKNALLEYCRGLAQYGLVKVSRNRFERQMLRVFVGTTRDRSEFHFHINQYEDFRRHLTRFGLYDANIRVIKHPLYTPVACEFPIKDNRPPRDDQIPLIEYLVADGTNKVVNLQTGKGKTYLSLKAIAQIGHRVVMVVKGMYVDKWIADIEQAFFFKKGDLMVCRGADHLKALITLGLTDNLEAKFIIITLKTMYNYLKAYEQFHTVDTGGFGIHPEQFYETLGAGVRLIDEVHQDFHCNYRQDLYTHVPKTISLSATLESDDPFTNTMYRINWPLDTRAPAVEYDKYIVVKSLWYTINDTRKIRCKNHMKQYSHVLFEQSIMKDKAMLANYINMITDIVTTSFISTYEAGQKMLVFCSTIELCTILANHLKSVNRDLKVARYVGEDQYEDLLTADIVVSTLLSAGTAVDVPNLRVCLMTTALSSKQSNLQALGRLRRLKDWPDIHPEFLFLSCREIEKHRMYAQQKTEKVEGKVHAFRSFELPHRI